MTQLSPAHEARPEAFKAPWAVGAFRPYGIQAVIQGKAKMLADAIDATDGAFFAEAHNYLLGELTAAQAELEHHRETLRQIMAWEGPSAFKHLCVPVAEANCQWCTAMADEYATQRDFYERHA